MPSLRTISNIAREMRTDDADAEPWRIADADPRTVALVLRVLAEVTRRTGGRVATLTRAEAGLVPVIHAAMEARWSRAPEDGQAWQTYVWTRFYLSWVRTDQDERDVALLFAALQGGKWPVTQWFQINRVLDAARACSMQRASGWLPAELMEVE